MNIKSVILIPLLPQNCSTNGFPVMKQSSNASNRKSRFKRDKKYTVRSQIKLRIGHTMQSLFKCELGGKSFGRRRNLYSHILMHTGEKPYNCKHCEKSFSQMSYCKSHENTHVAETQCKCEQCKKTFLWRHNLRKHLTITSGFEAPKMQLLLGTIQNIR